GAFFVGGVGTPAASRCFSRMRRTSPIVWGFAWHECGECTTSSDSTPSMCALSYSTTPSFLPGEGGATPAPLVRVPTTPGAIGRLDSAFTNGLPGVMLSTAVGALRVSLMAI